MRSKKFYCLKRPKLRQSWNKYNLYNLSRAKNIVDPGLTYYQQKWKSKAQTRAYHGETINEKHWQKLFRPTIRSVVPMDYKYLARHDGSEQALGRGSGLDPSPGTAPQIPKKTPYMNMVYAQMERRLDTAVFRAMFASSLRQARQFVVHGYVNVNGKKMIYPAYQLNPGDMFQVKPERVLFATGAPKDRGEAREDRRERRRLKAGSTDSSNSEPAVPAAEVIAPDPEATLLSLRQQVSTILSTTSPSAKRKQSLRALQRLLKSTLATHPTTLTDDVDAQLLELTSRLNISTPTSTPIPENSPTSKTAVMSSDERRRLREALALARENPIDLTKPYATPWRPRDYMSAFAFIPRYLEVHHRICSAVYLRHPVARPGLGEVPTPFPSEMNALAFNWYLRRR